MTTETPAPSPRTSRAGIVALVLGIIAVVAAVIPFLSYVAGLVGIAAIIVGIVALTRKTPTRRGSAVTGLVLGVVAVVLSIVLSIVYTTLFLLAGVASGVSSATPGGSVPVASDEPTVKPSASESASAGQRSVIYRVTGSGSAQDISYAVADASGAGQDQVSKAKLPWKKTIPIKSPSILSTTVFSIVAQRASSGSGKITCEIEVDGKVISKHSSSGAYAAVSCSGTAD